MRFLPVFLAFAVLLGNIRVDAKHCNSNSNSYSNCNCGNDEFKVSFIVKTCMSQKAVVQTYTSVEKVRSSKAFKKKLEKMSTSASVSGKYGLFSASVSAAYSSMTDSVESSENYSKDVKVDKITFNKGF